MRTHTRSLVFVVVLAAAVGAFDRPAAAQIPGLPGPAAPATSVEDPLRRDTPRGALMGFVTAAQAGNDAVAAEYLQWPRAPMSISRAEAARQLMFAMNHGFEGNIERVSRTPEGALDDGLPPDKERVGAVVLASRERVGIVLTHVPQADGHPPIWLVAAQTVADIPRLYKESGLPELERVLPRAVTRTQFGNLPAWVPVALLVLLPIIYGLVRLVLGCGAWIARRVARAAGKAGPPWLAGTWRAIVQPTAFLLTVYLHGAVGLRIGIPVYHRFLFERTITILFLAGFVWWLWRLQDLIATRIRTYLETTNAGRAQSAYILGRRALQLLTLLITVLVGLAAFGVDLSTTLAGLGIGGLALAFAAQKTLENVFAGISVLSDRSIVVGDFCQVGKYTGTVEDVGLRTMRLRTLGRTVVHVPNGTLATSEVENFSRRDKFLLKTTVGLRYDTTPDQLTDALERIRALLAADPLVEQDSMRVRLIKLAPYSLDVEMFAFLTVPDYPAFLAHQECVLLGLMRAVSAAGTGFAFPAQALPADPAR